jgi:threonine synthase
MSTLREPYRLEGKKTMGLELADQRDWTLPDVILYPTGGGTGLLGMDKAFRELRELGWLRGEKMPRFYACQSSGCPPIVRAWKKNAKHAETVRDAKTRASGLRVPAAVGDFLILESVRASGGMAVEADEDRMDFQMRRACALEGISICPETAICLEALENLVRSGTIGAQEDVLVWNTGAAQKYVECLEAPVGRIDRHKPLPPQLG